MWATFVVIAGGLGFFRGWEESNFRNDKQYRDQPKFWMKALLLAWFGVIIAAYAESVRGFFIVYLSALGAYYLAKMSGEPAQRLWYRWRDPHPILELSRRSIDSGQVDLWINSKCTSPLQVESIILMDMDRAIVPLISGVMGERKVEAKNNGWLEIGDVVIDRNGGGGILLTSNRWSDAATLRVIGKYSNGEYWIVEQSI